MTGEFFFMALGGLGVSLAGFVGIITALDRRLESRSEIALWRVRNIVISGFTLTVTGFGVIAIHTMTADVASSIRLASAFLLAANLAQVAVEFRPGPAWPDRNAWILAWVLQGLVVTGVVVAAIRGDVGLFQLILILELGFPMSMFFNTVRETARV